jgi:hypothetical protein
MKIVMTMNVTAAALCLIEHVSPVRAEKYRSVKNVIKADPATGQVLKRFVALAGQLTRYSR